MDASEEGRKGGGAEGGGGEHLRENVICGGPTVGFMQMTALLRDP